ncbi:MAG: hypothetical protein R3B99_03240 [Polyangiales bacterium]
MRTRRLFFGSILLVLSVTASGCGEPCNDASAASDVRGAFAVTVESTSGACEAVELPSSVQYGTFGLQVDGCVGGRSGFSATCRLDAELTCDAGGTFALDVLFDDDLDRAEGTMARSDASGAECVADVTLRRI